MKALAHRLALFALEAIVTLFFASLALWVVFWFFEACKLTVIV